MRIKEYTKNHSSQVCISRVFFIIILIVIAAAVQPIVAYAQPSLSEKWDYQDVLVLGVGADWNAAEVKELLNNYHFDKVIVISNGSVKMDYVKATLAKLGIPTGTIKKFEDLNSKSIKHLYAHSWGSSETINFLSKTKNGKIGELHCFGSPESVLFNHPLRKVINEGRVDKVFFHVNDGDIIAKYRHLPKLSIPAFSNKIEFHFYKKEIKSVDTKIDRFGFDKYYHYNCLEEGHPIIGYFKNSVFVINRDPKYSAFRGGDLPIFYTVPSYFVSPDPNNKRRSTNEAQILTETVHNKHKAIIIGKGHEADLMFKNMVSKLGEANVKRLYSFSDDKSLQLEAKKFGADVILGLKESSIKQTPNEIAKPGDLIIRHQGKTLGPIGGIPHIGIYTSNRTKDGASYDVIDLGIQDGKGVIRPSHWTDESKFKNPGFYSLLNSQIPVRYNGEITTLSALPEEVKNKIRENVVKMAEQDLGSTYGKYELSQFSKKGHSVNCGDWILDLYDKALTSEGIQVMSHKFPGSQKLLGKKGLKPGELKDYSELLWGSTDPSRLPGWLPQVTSPYAASKFEVPSYSILRDPKNPGKSMTEAQTLTETIHNKNKALIVGKGPEADLMYKNMVKKLGEGNVKRIDFYMDDKTLQLEARKFGADVILGVKGSKLPEAPDLGRADKRKRDDKYYKNNSGNPPPPPPPPPPSGVWIDPKPSKAGKGGSETKKKVLESRPSKDALFWEVK